MFKLVGAMAVFSAGLAVSPALADEGGTSFWVPGLYGSLAAAPVAPGWSFGNVFYHASESAGASKALPRDGQIVVGLDGTGDVDFFSPAYTLAPPVLDGQLQFSLAAIAGHESASVMATLTGPLGNTISGRREDDVGGFGDLYPQATLKWNAGSNNYMTYLTGDIPIGNYSPTRLANLGLGHGAIDGGGGYTYLNQTSGFEASAVLGFTGNFENTDTNYTSGIDAHLDWGVSQFFNAQLHAGVVGYFYEQITGDSGQGARLGNFESRVIGMGPQVGYIFPVDSGLQGYVNLKAYGEFAAENRPSGWNLWFTFNLANASPG